MQMHPFVAKEQVFKNAHLHSSVHVQTSSCVAHKEGNHPLPVTTHWMLLGEITARNVSAGALGGLPSRPRPGYEVCVGCHRLVRVHRLTLPKHNKLSRPPHAPCCRATRGHREHGKIIFPSTLGPRCPQKDWLKRTLDLCN